jgi:LuxR family maltose regulon positive regulatory protein
MILTGSDRETEQHEWFATDAGLPVTATGEREDVPAVDPSTPGGSIPRLPRDLLVRRRLEAHLDAWSPITVVRGAQGYGKTTLVAGWLDRRRDDVTSIWITADAEMDDPGAFARHLYDHAAASGLVGPIRAAGSQHESIVRELDRGLLSLPSDHRVLLVLDNAQQLRDESLLNSLVDRVQRYRQLHLIVCSRGRHPIELLAAGTVEFRILTASDLLLTEEEVHDLARAMGKRLTTIDAKRLYGSVGGWMAPLRLVLDTAGDGELPLAAATELLRTTVLHAVTDRQLLGNLMRFSLAERLDSRLVRDLAGDQHPDRLIAALQTPGFLEHSYAGEQLQLTFPTLIRDILRDVYTAREPDAARAFHRQLADWFSAHDGRDHILHAFRHAVAGQHWERLKEIWSQHDAALSMAYPELVHETLSALPEQVLNTYPPLLIAREVTGVDSDTDADGRMARLRAMYEVSDRLIRQHPDGLSLNELAHIGTGHVIGLRLRGRFDDAAAVTARIAAKIDHLVATGPDKPGDRYAWFHLQCGLTRTLIGNHDDAIASYQLAWEHGRRTQAYYVPSNAAANLALTYALRGETWRSEFWLERHRAFDTRAQWVHHLIGIGARVAAGLLALDRLDPAACRGELDHLGDGSGPVELWPFVAYLHAQYGLDHGDPGAALAALDAAQRAHDDALSNRGAAARLLTRVRADLLIACGEGERARHLLRHAAPADSVTLSVPLARLQLVAGDFPGARRTAAVVWNPATSTRDRLELLLIEATAALRMNDAPAATRLVGRALETLRPTGVLRAFTTIPWADLAALLTMAGQEPEGWSLGVVEAAAPVYPDRVELIALTRRERSLLAALETTASRQEIADSLHVSLNTVKGQLTSLYRKLGTTTRREALMKVRQLGLVADHPPSPS